MPLNRSKQGQGPGEVLVRFLGRLVLGAMLSAVVLLIAHLLSDDGDGGTPVRDGFDVPPNPDELRPLPIPTPARAAGAPAKDLVPTA